MRGFADYAVPEADPIADLADAVDNSKLQNNRKLIDNTEYYLVPVTVIDALLTVDDDTDVPPEPVEDPVLATIDPVAKETFEPTPRVGTDAPVKISEMEEFVALENPDEPAVNEDG